MQLETSLLMGLHQSPPSPEGKAEDTAPTEGWTYRSLNGHTGRADSIETSTATKTHRPQHQRTHTHNRQNHRAHKPKCRHWGPCIDKARITWGGGPMTSPGIGTGTRTAHRQADAPGTSQPATRTHELHRKGKHDSPGHVEHEWWGFHTPHTPKLLTAVQSDPPSSLFPTCTLWS